MLNRLANTQNRHQGDAKKVLAVCSAGLLRSPTIAWVLSNYPWNFNTRAAGATDEYALILVDDVLLDWADEIVCADESNAKIVREKIAKSEWIANKDNKKVHVANLPDIYSFRHPRLIELIEEWAGKTFKTSTATKTIYEANNGED